jgi:hypothetical protein
MALYHTIYENVMVLLDGIILWHYFRAICNCLKEYQANNSGMLVIMCHHSRMTERPRQSHYAIIFNYMPLLTGPCHKMSYNDM